MTESNSPFSLTVGTQLKIPSQKAWDLFIQPDQVKWNHALRSIEATLGFHTGSIVNVKFQTLRGLLAAKFEVIESIPSASLVLEHHFRYLLFKHTEQWHVRFLQNNQMQTCVEIHYAVSGPFIARFWSEKKLIVNNILNLWVESLKLQSERL